MSLKTLPPIGIAALLLLTACAESERNHSGAAAPFGPIQGGSGGLVIDLPSAGTAGDGFGGGPPAPTCADEQSSVGCDFYSVRPPSADFGSAEGRPDNSDGLCFAAYVVNVSPTPVTLRVDYRGTMLDTAKLARIPKGHGAALSYEPLRDGLLPPKEVAVLFLTHSRSSSVPCPSDVGIDTEGAPPELRASGRAHAFHITTSAPVAAYDIFPFGGGVSAITSATLLLPTRAWGTNYVGVTPYSTTSTKNAPVFQLVAAEDATEVTVRPNAPVRAGEGVVAAEAGLPVSYQLNRGEVLQLAAVDEMDLIGSPISSSKPVGAWAAMGCFNSGGAFDSCDSAHQQIPPVRALGSDYVAVRYRSRYETLTEFPPWRIVGAADGTLLKYDPTTPRGAPTSINAGQMVEFKTDKPFRVTSQNADHPFYLAAYMSSCSSLPIYSDQVDCRGDPEFVNVIPSEQYMPGYVFFTDPTYPETSLVVTRRKGEHGFEDVSLDCLGSIADWNEVGTDGQYQYAYVSLVSGNFEPQGMCDNGRHELTSRGQVGLTVWGWGSARTGAIDSPTYSQCVSYAYPAGASVRAINDVVVPPEVF